MILLLLIITILQAQDCKELQYDDPISIPFNQVMRIKLSDYVCDKTTCYKVVDIRDGLVYQERDICGFNVNGTLVDYSNFICDGYTNKDFGYKCDFSISLSLTTCHTAHDIYDNYEVVYDTSCQVGVSSI